MLDSILVHKFCCLKLSVIIPKIEILPAKAQIIRVPVGLETELNRRVKIQ